MFELAVEDSAYTQPDTQNKHKFVRYWTQSRLKY